MLAGTWGRLTGRKWIVRPVYSRKIKVIFNRPIYLLRRILKRKDRQGIKCLGEYKEKLQK